MPFLPITRSPSRIWRQQPVRTKAYIDWEHPLAKGLYICLTPWESGAGLYRNLADESNNAGNGPNVPVFDSGVHGVSLKGTETEFFYANLIFPKTETTHGAFPFASSVFMLLNSIQVATGSRLFCGAGQAGVSHDHALYVRNDGKLGLTAYAIERAVGTTTLVNGQAGSVGFSYADIGTNSIRLYVNGMMEDTGDIATLNSAPRIGEAIGYYNGYAAAHSLALMLAWDRLVSEAEFEAIHENPWQVFERRQRHIYIAAAATATFNAAWNASANTVVHTGALQ